MQCKYVYRLKDNAVQDTWMSRWKLGSMVRINGLFHLLINGVFWGYNPLILTIDPNFLGHPSSESNHLYSSVAIDSIEDQSCGL